MSHFKQRKENNCLNCGAEVQGRYCHVCGQENIEPKESFWHLVTHFVYDVTHFDGKFFSTVKYLLLRPGFLSVEYIRGKRMSYLNPIRMYVFISAFFFLFFFSVTKPVMEVKDKKGKKLFAVNVSNEIKQEISELSDEKKDTSNSIHENIKLQHRIDLLNEDLTTLKADTTNIYKLHYLQADTASFVIDTYKSHEQYDSLQNALSPGKRDGWLKKKVFHKSIDLNNEYTRDKGDLLQKFLEKFMHTFPQIFFISLPLFALLLKILYIRRKNYFYVNHVIYAIHLYCAIFLLLFLVIAINQLQSSHYLIWTHYLLWPLLLYIIWYGYKSLRNFYHQSRIKTIFKYLLLLFMFSIVMVILFAISALMTIFTV